MAIFGNVEKAIDINQYRKHEMRESKVVKDHATEIRNMMKRYIDFDIVYGDYDDYVNTRRGKKIQNRINVIENNGDKLSQGQIDMLIQMMGLKK